MDQKSIEESFQFRGSQEDYLVYLDSAATTQKPRQVIERTSRFYQLENANVHRGVYELSEKATVYYENVRKQVVDFIHADSTEEIIFTSGATDAINLVSQCWGGTYLSKGDEILLTPMEHHSNIVPWQILSSQVGAQIKWIPLTKRGQIDMDQARSMITEKTKIVAFTHVSNVLGTINPVKELVDLAHKVGAIAVVDGAQGAPHGLANIKSFGCDFYAFSSHKMLGPTGIGVLYGKKKWLEKMPPYRGGGDMISKVTFEGFSCNELPYKFEAGTPNIAGVIGFGEALKFLSQQDSKKLLKDEVALGRKLAAELRKNKEVVLYGDCQGDHTVGLVSFVHKKIHPHDLAAIFDSHRVCIRAGHHCAQPLHDYLGVEATSRASFYIYNNEADVERFLKALAHAESLFC